ncbi:MAG TPA: transglycosylase family protein [Acidimicrobiia bacterium]|nr:transglycosylase family protein [Acidimicrobiia bacterium]
MHVDSALATLRDPAAALRARPGRVRSARRAFAAGLGLLALVVAGGAALPGTPGAEASTQPARNQVTAVGDVFDRGPGGPMELRAPLVAMAATPTGRGYWLAGADGGVFAFGDAGFRGGLGDVALAAPVVGIASTPTGDGYWLAAADGGVFAFGDASFEGSGGGLDLAAPIVGIASTSTGNGYWLAAADGGVFAFGDADFAGSSAALGVSERIAAIGAGPDGGYVLAGEGGGVYAFGGAPHAGSAQLPGAPEITAIAMDPDGRGYWLLRANGAVQAIGARYFGDAGWVDLNTAAVPNVAIAAAPSGRGYWVAQGDVPPPPPVVRRVDQNHPFLVCTRAHESDTSGGYRAVSASGTYRGAYQFSRSTWDSTARHAGRLDLVGVDPAAASPADQDELALHLYEWQGASPWLGRCAGL